MSAPVKRGWLVALAYVLMCCFAGAATAAMFPREVHGWLWLRLAVGLPAISCLLILRHVRIGVQP